MRHFWSNVRCQPSRTTNITLHTKSHRAITHFKYPLQMLWVTQRRITRKLQPAIVGPKRSFTVGSVTKSCTVLRTDSMSQREWQMVKTNQNQRNYTKQTQSKETMARKNMFYQSWLLKSLHEKTSSNRHFHTGDGVTHSAHYSRSNNI